MKCDNMKCSWYRHDSYNCTIDNHCLRIKNVEQCEKYIPQENNMQHIGLGAGLATLAIWGFIAAAVVAGVWVWQSGAVSSVTSSVVAALPSVTG